MLERQFVLQPRSPLPPPPPISQNMPLLHCRNCPTNHLRLPAAISKMVDEAELQAIASQPTSSHILRVGSACQLASYTEIVMSQMAGKGNALHRQRPSRSLPATPPHTLHYWQSLLNGHYPVSTPYQIDTINTIACKKKLLNKMDSPSRDIFFKKAKLHAVFVLFAETHKIDVFSHCHQNVFPSQEWCTFYLYLYKVNPRSVYETSLYGDWFVYFIVCSMNGY